MRKINFLILGDTNFFKTIHFSVSQIHKYHPNSLITIYNWGFTEKEEAILNSHHNLSIINWKDRFLKNSLILKEFPKTPLTYTAKLILEILNIHQSKSFSKFIPNRINNRLKRERLYIEKILCLNHFVLNHTGSFIYLDADAFIINSIDQAFNADYDIGVTIRRENEISYGFSNCRILNAGVLFFNSSQKSHLEFMHHWLTKSSITLEKLMEQTALSRIIFPKKTIPQSLSASKRLLRIKNHNIKIKIFKCENYNFNWVEEEIDPEKNRIIHIKGGRHNSERVDNYINMFSQ